MGDPIQDSGPEPLIGIRFRITLNEIFKRVRHILLRKASSAVLKVTNLLENRRLSHFLEALLGYTQLVDVDF